MVWLLALLVGCDRGLDCTARTTPCPSFFVLTVADVPDDQGDVELIVELSDGRSVNCVWGVATSAPCPGDYEAEAERDGTTLHFESGTTGAGGDVHVIVRIAGEVRLDTTFLPDWEHREGPCLGDCWQGEHELFL